MDTYRDNNKNFESNSILIINNNENDEKKLSQYLNKHNIISFYAKDIGETRNILNHFTPEIVLIDYDLEYSNGIDLMKEIKNEIRKSTCIMTTDVDSHELKINALKNGFDDIINKPLTETYFINIINKTFKTRDDTLRKYLKTTNEDYQQWISNLLTNLLVIQQSQVIYRNGRFKEESDIFIQKLLDTIKIFSISVLDDKLEEITFGNYQIFIKTNPLLNIAIIALISNESYKIIRLKHLMTDVSEILTKLLNKVINQKLIKEESSKYNKF